MTAVHQENIEICRQRKVPLPRGKQPSTEKGPKTEDQSRMHIGVEYLAIVPNISKMIYHLNKP